MGQNETKKYKPKFSGRQENVRNDEKINQNYARCLKSGGLWKRHNYFFVNLYKLTGL